MTYFSKRLAATVIAVCLGAPFSVHATNGYQLIGVGSYQKSMGGAVTSNPDTAMTAISNPAGMARVGKRADFNMEMFMPDRFVDFGATGAKEDSAAELYGVPAIGWTAPVSDDRPDLYFGGGMYGTSGLGADYASTLIGGNNYFDGYSSIAFWQMAPTLAWNVDERLSLGVALNLDYQSVAFKQRIMQDAIGGDGIPDTTVQNFDLSRNAQGLGIGATVGLIYDINDRITVGASYKSKQEFSDMEYQLAPGDLLNLDPSTATGCNVPVAGGFACPGGTYDLELDYPQQLAAGITFRPGKRVEVSADIKWVDWSSTMKEIKITGPAGAQVILPANWDDQTIYAIGVHYEATDRFHVRAGFNYAEAPFDDEDVSANLILPATVETHYAIGADYHLNNRWDIGFHYMIAPEQTFQAPANDPLAPGVEIGLSEQSFGIDLGYRF